MINKKSLLLSTLVFTCEAIAHSGYTYPSGHEIKIKNQAAEIISGNQTPELILKKKGDNRESHVTFSQFNVGRNGLDINNEINARYIITEVISDNISRLEGNIRVTKNQANLFIVNPNGITVKNQFKISGTMHNYLITGRLKDNIDDWDDFTAEQTEHKGGKLLISGANRRGNFNNTTLISSNIRMRKSKLYANNLQIETILNRYDGYSRPPKITISKDTKIHAGLLTAELTGVKFKNFGTITGDLDFKTTDASIENRGTLTGGTGKITYRGNMSFNGKNNTKYNNSDVFRAVDDHSIFDTGLKTVSIE
ncbi:TPA: filamentous hemagglutinin N-terminal domain-containing protein [Morganella morganii]|nr:filamentous hemagglutinin N-terminal domain-containing protein [Morganella morganii]